MRSAGFPSTSHVLWFAHFRPFAENNVDWPIHVVHVFYPNLEVANKLGTDLINPLLLVSDPVLFHITAEETPVVPKAGNSRGEGSSAGINHQVSGLREHLDKKLHLRQRLLRH